jgi:ABC-type branched-subunit amino acid transport system permease subunit
VITVWAVEAVVFALVVAALLAERPLPLAATAVTLAAVAVLLWLGPGLRRQLGVIFTRHRRAAWLGGAVFALLLPAALRGSPYWTFVATMALLYVTIGQGLNFQIGTAGVINLAGAAFAGLGGYTVGLLTVGLGVPPLLALLIGPLAAMVVGAILFVPILKTRGHYLALVTIAFGFIFNILMNNLEFTGGPQGIKNIPTLRPFGHVFSGPLRLGDFVLPSHANFYYAALVMAAVVTLGMWRLHNSWLGLALNTLRDDEIAARCSGVNVARQKLVAFSIGNFAIGLGGAFYALMVGFVSPPDFDFGYSLIMLSVIILGGVDSVPGIVLGACLLIPLPERFRFLHEYRLLLYGIVIVLMLLFRPRGLWPASVRRFPLAGASTAPSATSPSDRIVPAKPALESR